MTDKQLMIPNLEEVKALQLVDQMDALLERADDWDAMLNVRNGALGIATMAGAMKMGEVAQRAKIVQLKAERKAGGWAASQPKRTGGWPVDVARRGADEQEVLSMPELAERLGLGLTVLTEWQRMSRVPDRLFLRWLDDCLKDNIEVSHGGFLRFIKPAGPKPEPEKPLSLLDRMAELLKDWSALLYSIGAHRSAAEAKSHLAPAKQAVATLTTMLKDAKELVSDLEEASK